MFLLATPMMPTRVARFIYVPVKNGAAKVSGRVSAKSGWRFLFRSHHPGQTIG